MSKVSLDDCWLYAEMIGNRGYGRVQHYVGRKYTATEAHVVMYENVVGRVPTGLEIDHLCRVTVCINPEHLEAVTHKENMRRWRGNQEGYCIRGHLLSDDNVYTFITVTGTVKKHCRKCVLDRAKLRNKGMERSK